MSAQLPALVALFAAAALSLVLPLPIRPLLERLGIVDIPNARSSHERPVLRGLGLAVLIAVTLTGGAAAWWLWGDAQQPTSGPILLAVLGGIAAAGLLGLAEDLCGISVTVRSVLLLALAACAAVAVLLLAQEAHGLRVFGYAPIQFGHDAFVHELPVWAVIALAVYGVLFISSYINVANFMDGLNGISGLHGVVAGLTFAGAGIITGLPWLACAGGILAGGFAGFLPWNLSRRGAFLGDVGSYLLGGGVAITSFAALIAGVPLLAAIGPMVIYFGDVGVTLVRRVRAGHKWDEPHKEHAYQRIQQLGYTHVQASGLAAGCTVLTSLLGLMSIFAPSLWVAGILFVIALAVLVLYLGLPRILPPRGAAAPRPNDGHTR